MICFSQSIQTIHEPWKGTIYIMNTRPSRDYWPTADWKKASPQDMGMDAALLAEMHDYASEHIPQLHAMLIVRHGDTGRASKLCYRLDSQAERGRPSCRCPIRLLMLGDITREPCRLFCVGLRR